MVCFRFDYMVRTRFVSLFCLGRINHGLRVYIFVFMGCTFYLVLFQKKYSSELPPISTAVLANFFHLLEFPLIVLLLSLSRTSLMHFSTSSLVTIPFSFTFTITPTCQTSVIYLALVGWSLHCGIATIGTPKLNASSVEFHPQWVMKHPTDLWARTCSWGHHFMIRPVFDVSFTKSLGSLFSSDSLTIHRKHLLLRLRPQPSSAMMDTCYLCPSPQIVFFLNIWRSMWVFSHLYSHKP